MTAQGHSRSSPLLSI